MVDFRAGSVASRRTLLKTAASFPLAGAKALAINAGTRMTLPWLERYHAFLAREAAAVLAEIDMLRNPGRDSGFDLRQVESYRHEVPFYLLREDALVERTIADRPPSSRAEAVLGATGLALESGGGAQATPAAARQPA